MQGDVWQTMGMFNDKTIVNDPIKDLDPIGICQRLVFTVGLSQNMHKINKPVNI